MRGVDWIAISAKAVLAWLVLSVVGIRFGATLGEPLLPLLEFVIRLASPDFAPAVSLVSEQYEVLIRLSGLVMRPLHLADRQIIQPGTELTAQTHLLHTLAPAVIELSIVLSWPVSNWPGRLVGVLLGLATAIVVIVITAPFVLLGTIEIQFQELVQNARGTRAEPWPLTWMLFCETGGRWLLAVIAALVSIQVQQALLAYRFERL